MQAKFPSWRQYNPVQVIFTVCFFIFPTVAKTIMIMHTVTMYLYKMVKEIRSGYVLKMKSLSVASSLHSLSWKPSQGTSDTELDIWNLTIQIQPQ